MRATFAKKLKLNFFFFFFFFFFCSLQPVTDKLNSTHHLKQIHWTPVNPNKALPPSPPPGKEGKGVCSGQATDED